MGSGCFIRTDNHRGPQGSAWPHKRLGLNFSLEGLWRISQMPNTVGVAWHTPPKSIRNRFVAKGLHSAAWAIIKQKNENYSSDQIFGRRGAGAKRSRPVAAINLIAAVPYLEVGRGRSLAYRSSATIPHSNQRVSPEAIGKTGWIPRRVPHGLS